MAAIVQDLNENRRCAQCAADARCLRNIYTLGKYTMFRCATCGLAFAWPRPTTAELGAFYNAPEYFEHEGDGFGYDSYQQLEPALSEIARRQLRTISRYSKSGTLLDYGCAYGFFVRESVKVGYDSYGVDYSADAIANACLNIHPDRFQVITSPKQLPEKHFDVITLWEVIEHLLDPRETLEQLRKHLRPGGLIALSTPNGSNWTARLTPQTYQEFKLPDHLNIYRLPTLRQLLKQTGFKILSCQYQYPVTHRVVSSPLESWLRRSYDLPADVGTRWVWQNRAAAIPAYWFGIYSFNLVNDLVNRLTSPTFTHKSIEVYAELN